MEKLNFDPSKLDAPCYIVDEKLLESNLEILKGVIDKTDCKILLAQKAFSMFAVYPLIAKYISGATASGLNEARLGYEEFKKENHIFAPAYNVDEFDEICEYADHIVFNSIKQLNKFNGKAKEKGKELGLRINPEFSTQDHAIYDPCAPGSRMGVRLCDFDEAVLDDISGLHFHTLCEQGADALAATLEVVEKNWGKYLYGLKWVNLGGGHHITKSGYDVDLLIKTINNLKNKYGVQVYLEPGEAIALNAGFLVAEVMETMKNGINIAILSASPSCHMPDVLEMPYRPNIIGAGLPDEKAFTYRLGGNTCLAGDIIGDYSFSEPLKDGDRLVFLDMAIYSMVKNNTFNGINLPSIYMCDKGGKVTKIRSFGYDDFKKRLS
jgi:carboxynorspermidine decarboxylase